MTFQKENESWDAVGTTGFSVLQDLNGYRFSLDPVLLASFCSLRSGWRCLDLGTGCGVIPLLLKARQPELEVLALELQAEAVERARRTMLANAVREVEVRQGDVRQIDEIAAEPPFDLVISNPPFRPSSRGRIPPQRERAYARFELAGGLSDFVAAGARVLKKKGAFALIHLAERTDDVFRCLAENKLTPRRLRFVHPRQGEAARLVLIEAWKGEGQGVGVLPPLYLYRQGASESRQYTQEVLQLYGMGSG